MIGPPHREAAKEEPAKKSPANAPAWGFHTGKEISAPNSGVALREETSSQLAESALERRARSVGTSATLAAAGGFLDAFTYIGHGHVFANAMTGNVVLLGLDAISGSWRPSLSHLLPILMFLLGVASARAVCADGARRRLKHPGLAVLTVEIIAFFSLGWLPPATPSFAITMSIAFVASLQMATFRDLNGRSYSSTFTSGNLRTMIENAFDWAFLGRQHRHLAATFDFATICFAFFLGAFAGAFTTPRLQNRTLWVDVVVLACLLCWLVESLRGRPGEAASNLDPGGEAA